jgi:hypothetical protein
MENDKLRPIFLIYHTGFLVFDFFFKFFKFFLNQIKSIGFW